MYEIDPDFRYAEFIAEAESVVYRLGDYAYKLYKWASMEDVIKYQALTHAAAEALNGVRMYFQTEGGGNNLYLGSDSGFISFYATNKTLCCVSFYTRTYTK